MDYPLGKIDAGEIDDGEIDADNDQNISENRDQRLVSRIDGSEIVSSRDYDDRSSNN